MSHFIRLLADRARCVYPPGSLWCLLIAIVFVFSACGNSSSPTQTVNLTYSPTTAPPHATTASVSATGTFHEYALPQANSGLMRPTIDHEGRIWFGEMGRNYLAMFDPRTATFQQIKPPRGMFGIMGIEVASDDTIWFAEQYANYIGHYIPTTGQFFLYSLPQVTVPDASNPGKSMTLPAAPNDLVIDAQGNIWFTELNANAIGRLDPHSGTIRQFAITSTKQAAPLDPYGIAVDSQGIVWFTEATNNRIWRLDPAMGAIRSYVVPSSSITLMEIAADAHGTIWATSFNSGLLVSLNSQSGAMAIYYAPVPDGNAGGLYGLTITPDDQVWVTISAFSIIARLDVVADRFVYYAIPTANSLPIGIVPGARQSLWFTEAGSDKIGMLQP